MTLTTPSSQSASTTSSDDETIDSQAQGYEPVSLFAAVGYPYRQSNWLNLLLVPSLIMFVITVILGKMVAIGLAMLSVMVVLQNVLLMGYAWVLAKTMMPALTQLASNQANNVEDAFWRLPDAPAWGAHVGDVLKYGATLFVYMAVFYYVLSVTLFSNPFLAQVFQTQASQSALAALVVFQGLVIVLVPVVLAPVINALKHNKLSGLFQFAHIKSMLQAHYGKAIHAMIRVTVLSAFYVLISFLLMIVHLEIVMLVLLYPMLISQWIMLLDAFKEPSLDA